MKIIGMKISAASLFLWLGLGLASAQSWMESFNVINQSARQTSLVDERVMMVTDRDIYLCGEKIAFNAFVFDGNWFLPLDLSAVLYIELYNQDNIVITRSKFPIEKGRSSGMLTVPRTIGSNIYYLRAYTGYMRNFGLEQFFLKKLRIINPFLTLPVYTPPVIENNVINCRINPEGGNLIAGVRNRVGCRFSNSRGQGLEAIARLVDNDKNIITTFRTYKNGFASFEFVPSEGKRYEIEVAGENAQALIPLGEPQKSGITLSVDSISSENLTITVSASGTGKFPLKLNARHGEFIYPLRETYINEPGTYNISLMRIPVGLVILELKDFNENTVAGRLFYKKSSDNIRITMKTDKEKYGNREKVQLTLNASDRNGIPVKAEMNLFTCLAGSIQSGSPPDISFPENVLMQIELNRYFNFNPDITEGAETDSKLLELILLGTSPHDRKYKTLTPGNLRYLPETRGDIVSGRLIFKDNQPVKGIEILQSFIGEGSWIESTFTDEKGNFSFVNMKQVNRGDLIIKVKNSTSEASVLMDDEFFREFPTPVKEELDFTKEEIDLISKQFINIQVEDAYAEENPGAVKNTSAGALPFYGKEFKEYVFQQYFKLPNMREFIFEVIMGVILEREDRKDVISIIEEGATRKIGPNPLILIDGVPVDDHSAVVNLNPEKVKLVRVVRYRYFYKKQVFDGILDIITYSGDATDFRLPVNTFRIRFEPLRGKYIAPIPFIQSENHGKIPIYKNLLHWDPYISSVQDGRIVIDFFRIRFEPLKDKYVAPVPFIQAENEGKIPVYKNLLHWDPYISSGQNGRIVIDFYTPDNSGIFELRCTGRTQEGFTTETRTFITVGK